MTDDKIALRALLEKGSDTSAYRLCHPNVLTMKTVEP
jgi:hypothetical protein